MQVTQLDETQRFELTLSPEMSQSKAKSVSNAKVKSSNNKQKRCNDTVDFVEELFGDKYKKCKWSGY